ncbi:hypothetical protein AVEN_36074-1 [Araneus ventricosus]|uniref:Uncharacterized protein n=1 Tax=Araneus ventricosus TaxID=182803 RepID=A0A4Y2S8X6_ARAVE|nr:hypothetical protein AVEN_36074-1 [Araneus ventricosus]
MEFLEHWKENAIVKVENIWNLEEMILSGGIPPNSKSQISCADSKLRPRCDGSGRSKCLSRLRPRDEARKSKIRRVGGRNRGIEELR